MKIGPKSLWHWRDQWDCRVPNNSWLCFLWLWLNWSIGYQHFSLISRINLPLVSRSQMWRIWQDCCRLLRWSPMNYLAFLSRFPVSKWRNVQALHWRSTHLGAGWFDFLCNLDPQNKPATYLCEAKNLHDLMFQRTHRSEVELVSALCALERSFPWKRGYLNRASLNWLALTFCLPCLVALVIFSLRPFMYKYNFDRSKGISGSIALSSKTNIFFRKMKKCYGLN